MSTEYKILRRRESAESLDGGAPWMEAGTVEASSAREAIRKSVTESGTVVAVPARSWLPLTVSIETKQKVTLS